MLKLNQLGVTIVELMVGLLMTSLITAAGFAIYLRSHETYLAQAEVNDLQYRVRDALTEVSNNMQMAGYLLPEALTPLVTKNTNPDTVVIQYQQVGGCLATLSQAMAQPTGVLNCAGQNLSCFQNNQVVYIYDPASKTGESFTITQVDDAADQIQHAVAFSKSYPVGSTVSKIISRKYFIDKTTDPTHPRLMVSRNGAAAEIYAGDITDLQFVYTMADGSVTSTPVSPRLVREVEITMTGKATKRDVDWNNLVRNRTFSTRVKVRNLDL